MKWYKRDPDAARLAWLRAKHGQDCCGEFPAPAHIQHFVYVLGRLSGPTKVGICKNLALRVRSLQTACPFQIDLFWSACVPSREIAREMEVFILEQFPKANGEWVDAIPAALIDALEG